MKKFNLNADMGESYGPWKMGDDGALLDIVSTANLACGFHAGDHQILAEVMSKAKEKGVSVGAHPSFLDIHGFGRRDMHLPETEIERLMAYQIGAALGMAALTGHRITHVKPHGAISNMAARDASMAAAISRAIKAVDPSLIFLAPVFSEMAREGEKAGLTIALEIFADRAYLGNGLLVPRSRPDAMIHDPKLAAARAVRMFEAGEVETVDGTTLKLEAHSICVHGDGPEALNLASETRRALEAAGFTPTPLPAMLD